MATSGYFIYASHRRGLWEPTGSKTEYDALFEWDRTSYSVVSNTSTIQWRLRFSGLHSKDTWWYGYNNSSSYKYTVIIDGVTYTGKYSGTDKARDTIIASGNATILHLSDGTKTFSVTVDAVTGDIGGTGSSSFTLDAIPRPASITSAEDFTDDDNPTVYYDNPSGNLVTSLDICISLDGSKDDIAYRAVGKNDSSYTFNLTPAERNVLRNSITSTSYRTVKFILRTYTNGEYFYSQVTRTLTLVGYEPTLNPTVKDTNTITINLTGSDQTFIRYYSNLYFNSGAQAHKNATIASQIIANGNQSFHDVSTGTFNKVESSLLKFTATDSRGFTVKQDVDLLMIPYTPVTARLNINRLTLQGELSFTLDGNYYNGSFGTTDNQLVIQYTLTKNGQPLREVTIDPTTDGTFEASSTEYRFEYTIPDLVIQEGDEYNTYSIQATVNDKLSSATTDIRSTTAMPIFDWSKADFKFNVPVHFSRGYTSDVNVKATSFSRSISVETAGNHLFCTRQDLEIHDSHFTSNSDIYNISGSMDYGGARYMIPSPNLSEDGTVTDSQSMKFWVSGDNIYLVTNSAWGTNVPIRIIVQYI